MVKISDQQIDELVKMAETDQRFKDDLQAMDRLAFKKRITLKEMIEEAMDWYASYKTFHIKNLNK